MARRLWWLAPLVLVGALIGGCSARSANAVFLVPGTNLDHLKPALEAIALKRGLHPRARISTTEPCTVAEFSDDPKYRLSLKARRLGKNYEVRLVSMPPGGGYPPFEALAADLEQAVRAIYGRSVRVSRDVAVYPMCSVS